MSTLIILIILLCLSAFFSATETALTGANRIRLKNQAEGGDKKAALALKLIGDYDSALSTLLIANNIVNILASSLTTVFFINLLGASAVGVATAVTTVAVIIFGEVLPKSFANENAENMIKTATLEEYIKAAKQLCIEENIPLCDCYEIWSALKKNKVNTTRLLANRINHPIEKMHWLFAFKLIEIIFKEEN